MIRTSMRDPSSDKRYAIEKRLAKRFDKVLVAGCYTYEPIVLGASHACDINGLFIEDLKKNGYKGEAIIADICKLPYINDFFDCVFCTETLEHQQTLDEVKLAISEILRVGKYFFISVPAKKSKNATTHYQQFTIKSLSKLLPEGSRVWIFKPFIFATNIPEVSDVHKK